MPRSREILVNGVLQLNDPNGRWWIAKATSPRTPAARRHVSLTLPGRDGEYPMSREPRNAGTYALVMHFQAADAATADRYVSWVLSAMSGEFLMVETLYSALGSLSRRAYGALNNGVSIAKKPKLKVLEVTIPITLTDGRWLTPSAPQTTLPALSTSATLITLDSALYNTDAETDEIIIRIGTKALGKVSLFGADYNFRLGTSLVQKTGISYNPAIPASNYVFIDVKNFVAKQTTTSTDWAMATGTDVSGGLDYPASGKLELMPVYDSASQTSRLNLFSQAESPVTGASVVVQVRGAYQ